MGLISSAYKYVLHIYHLFNLTRFRFEIHPV